MVLQFMQLPQELIDWLNQTKEQLILAKESSSHHAKFDMPSIQGMGLAFEDMVKSIGINFVFQYQDEGKYLYYCYW